MGSNADRGRGPSSHMLVSMTTLMRPTSCRTNKNDGNAQELHVVLRMVVTPGSYPYKLVIKKGPGAARANKYGNEVH